jgi:hypothetical protein
MCLVVAELAHSQEPKKSEAASLQGHDEIISQLRTAYAAFNRGDFDAALPYLIPRSNGQNPWSFLVAVRTTVARPLSVI